MSSAGCCLFSAQTFVPGVFFKLRAEQRGDRLVGKVMPHMGPMVALLLNITPVIAFNSLLLLPHAEALRRATGLRMFTGSFLDLGERSYNLERLYNLREGLTAKDDYQSTERLTGTCRTPQMNGPESRWRRCSPFIIRCAAGTGMVGRQSGSSAGSA